MKRLHSILPSHLPVSSFSIPDTSTSPFSVLSHRSISLSERNFLVSMLYTLFSHVYTHHCSGHIMKSNSYLQNLIFNSILSWFSTVLLRNLIQTVCIMFCFSLYGSMFHHSLIVLVSNVFHQLYCCIVLELVITFLLQFHEIYKHFYLPIALFINSPPHPKALHTSQINKCYLPYNCFTCYSWLVSLVPLKSSETPSWPHSSSVCIPT